MDILIPKSPIAILLSKLDTLTIISNGTVIYYKSNNILLFKYNKITTMMYVCHREIYNSIIVSSSIISHHDLTYLIRQYLEKYFNIKILKVEYLRIND